MITDPEDVAEANAIHAALAAVPWNTHSNVTNKILTRWTLVAEFYDPTDDDHTILRVHEARMQVWDARGLLHEALRDWDD